MAFVKLHGSILDSSVWGQPHTVRLVWITMLAMADEHGVVSASVDGLARRAVVTVAEAEQALAIFLGPDQYSRDGTTGERCERVPGGWLVLNHANYRERQTDQQIETAARVARHRAKKRRESVTSNNVTPSNRLSPSEAEAEAEAEIRSRGREQKKKTPREGEGARKRAPALPPTGASSSVAARWTRFPPEYVLTADDHAFANKLGVDLETEHAKLLDYEFPRAKIDPRAALRTWLRHAQSFALQGETDDFERALRARNAVADRRLSSP